MRKLLIQFAFGQIKKHLISKIKLEPLQTFLGDEMGLLETIADKLTDSDPDDDAQLKAIWDAEQARLKQRSVKAALDTLRGYVENPDLMLDIEALVHIATVK